MYVDGGLNASRSDTPSGKPAAAGGRGMDQGFKPSEGNSVLFFSRPVQPHALR